MPFWPLFYFSPPPASRQGGREKKKRKEKKCRGLYGRLRSLSGKWNFCKGKKGPGHANRFFLVSTVRRSDDGCASVSGGNAARGALPRVCLLKGLHHPFLTVCYDLKCLMRSQEEVFSGIFVPDASSVRQHPPLANRTFVIHLKTTTTPCGWVTPNPSPRMRPGL